MPKAMRNCKRCKRIFHPDAPANIHCVRCRMYGAALFARFNSIIKQKDMLEFKAEMEEWYLNETG